jgi:cytochrome P450
MLAVGPSWPWGRVGRGAELAVGPSWPWGRVGRGAELAVGLLAKGRSAKEQCAPPAPAGEKETMMRISTRTHALLDFATVGFALAFPRLLGASPRFTKVATALALGKLGYTLLTRHEGGAAKLISMKTHLQLDMVGGAAMAALPQVLDVQEEHAAVKACAVGLGLFDIAAAPLTESQSNPRVDDHRIRRPIDRGDGATPRSRGARGQQLPTASVADTLKIVAQVAVPNIAKGPIIRRQAVMERAERYGFDTAAVRLLQRMRSKYGKGPLLLRLPFRSQAVLLDPDHVRRVLDESPDPFATASTEKQAALAHFEPKNALVSHGPERTARRQLNEQVLEPYHATHPLSERFLPILDEEVGLLLEQVDQVGELRWKDFSDAWFRIVRRIIFGDSARDDTRITDLMAELRSAGNWAFLHPRRTDLRDELHRRIRSYLERGEPGSLAAVMASRLRSPMQAPENQIPQWLFAFDPAAMATFRALALLATHPDQAERACAEATGGVAAARPHRPFLRACILESLRLWPTTPLILRQTTRDTEWENGMMPAQTGVLIFAPFFHRDDERLPFAHAFHPDVWIEDDPEVKGFPPRIWPFVPFSGGKAHCPGQSLVLLLTSNMLAALIGDRSVRLKDPHRMPPGRLPGSQNHFTLRFELGESIPGRMAQRAQHEKALSKPPST